MVRLHLSKFVHHGLADTDPQLLVPACGIDDGRAILRRGRGEGLVPPIAISAEFHCSDCVRELREATKRAIHAEHWRHDRLTNERNHD